MIIIDVREPQEFAGGHVEWAINIPPAELMANTDKLSDIPKDAEIVLYCVSGSRSEVSKKILEGMGYTNVTNGINKHHVQAKFTSR
jgi:rhodanese-related sulfurtransferase